MNRKFQNFYIKIPQIVQQTYHHKSWSLHWYENPLLVQAKQTQRVRKNFLVQKELSFDWKEFIFGKKEVSFDWKEFNSYWRVQSLTRECWHRKSLVRTLRHHLVESKFWKYNLKSKAFLSRYILKTLIIVCLNYDSQCTT